MIAVATGFRSAIEDIETRVIEQNLQQELQNFQQHYKNNPDQPLPHSASMTSYLAGPGELARLPAYIRDLSPGTYELNQNDKVMQVIIGEVGNKKIALEVDATLFEEREDRISNALIFAVISASVLALWLGYALSQRAIAPVTNLAQRVAGLEPGKPAERLSTHYVNDEVGELARSFDRYLDRLNEFVAREQEFTANASHELRTPLTIINGAVELLSVDPSLSERSLAVLQRIDRATSNMSQMVDTLLVLAREEKIPEEETARMSTVAEAVVEENTHTLKNKSVTLETIVKTDFSLEVSQSILTILLGNILRNAIAFTQEGRISVIVDSPTIAIADTGTGIATEELPYIFERHYRANNQESGGTGSGIGLAIVKRICDRYGWEIDISSDTGKGTVVTVDFNRSVEK
jgi:signal transduction histidine kinase